MDREEILAAARENKAKNEEYENDTSIRGGNFSILIGLLIGIVIVLVEMLVTRKVNFGLSTTIFATASIQAIYDAVRLRKKGAAIWGIYCAVSALFSFVMFIGTMVVS